jgi:hypothetical protein
MVCSPFLQCAPLRNAFRFAQPPAPPKPFTARRAFRYAPLSSGLDIIRKSLGRHAIAIVQSTAIDKEA